MHIAPQTPRYMVVSMFPPGQSKEDILKDFEEARDLIKTYGADVYAIATQSSSHASKATFIGSGKIQEVMQKIQDEHIDIVVINANITAGQIYTLKKIFQSVKNEIAVWDRTDLILKIFEKHAHTTEAKLQIRLAHMRHMGPRIYGMGFELSQQAGGIGTKGIGETNTELMKRHWRLELKQIKKHLEKLRKSRDLQMSRRKRVGKDTVSLIGYTNAGKTSLFNILCGKKNSVRDALFVTLESSVGTFYLPSTSRGVFISDTIGFIKDLPPKLIEAFKSTLMEVVEAKLLLHVIDVSDERIEEKISIVNRILYELMLEKKQQVFIFNKIDRAGKELINKLEIKYKSFHPHFVSAKNGDGIHNLIQSLETYL